MRRSRSSCAPASLLGCRQFAGEVILRPPTIHSSRLCLLLLAVLHPSEGDWLGWFYLSTALDDFSVTSSPGSSAPPPRRRAILTAAPALALQASGLGQAEHQSAATPAHLLSDNGPSYLAADLSDWLDSRGMPHIRGKPNHPMTQARSGAGLSH